MSIKIITKSPTVEPADIHLHGLIHPDDDGHEGTFINT